MDTTFALTFGLLLVLVITLALNASEAPVRVKEYSFPNVTVVLKRKVTCDGASPLTNVYPAETWACRDMKIDGFRMRYWYRSGTDHPCTDAPKNFDANMTYRNNDESGLCRELLKANNIVKPLSVAYVHEPSCSHSVQQRIVLEKNLDKGHLNWDMVDPGPGYMRTLRCMVKD